MRLHVYSNDHPSGWLLSVHMAGQPLDDFTNSTALCRPSLQKTSVWAVNPGHGELDPTWKCFGFHPAWPSSHVCPAPQGDDGVILAERTSRGWHDFTLGMKLLLDGSEGPGTYQGVLRYSVVTF